MAHLGYSSCSVVQKRQLPGGLPIPRIGFSFGNALTIGLLGGVGFLMLGGGLVLLSHYNIPLLSQAAQAVTAAFNFSGKAF